MGRFVVGPVSPRQTQPPASNHHAFHPSPAHSSAICQMSAFHHYEGQPASATGTTSDTPCALPTQQLASAQPQDVQRRPNASIIGRLTAGLVHTYRVVNPSGFGYRQEGNPRRALTKPADGVKNEGHDNDDNDLIMHVNDVLLNSQPSDGMDRAYIVQEMLGQASPSATLPFAASPLKTLDQDNSKPPVSPPCACDKLVLML